MGCDGFHQLMVRSSYNDLEENLLVNIIKQVSNILVTKKHF